MYTFWKDIKAATRGLIQSGGFAALTVIVLGVGIGGNAALFAIVQNVLLRPLPYSAAKRLFVIREVIPEWSKMSPSLPANARHFDEWRNQSSSFEQMAVIKPIMLNLTGGSEPKQVPGARVSAVLFRMLGVQPELGRLFFEDEDKPGNDQVVLLTDGFWRREFGGNPAILGKKVILSNTVFTVVGILPRSFWFPKDNELGSFVPLAKRTEVFKPLGLSLATARPVGNHAWAVIGLLKAGVTPQQATAELNGVQAQIAKDLPEKIHLKATLVPLKQEIVEGYDRRLWVLLAAMAAVLVMICANLATVLLARAARRNREIAIRRALGANTGRIYRLVLTEGLLLGLAGGLFGVVLGFWSLRILLASAPSSLPRLEEVSLANGVLGTSLFLATFTGILFGLIPGWYLTQKEPSTAIRETNLGIAALPRWAQLHSILVGFEVSISVVLLIVTGLLLHSYLLLTNVNKGFSENNLLAADVSLPAYKYQNDFKRTSFYQAALQRIASLPGILSVSVVSTTPLRGETGLDSIAPKGDTKSEGEHPLVNLRYVNSSYFRTLGIPLLAGRVFEDVDRKPSAQEESTAPCPACSALISSIIVSESTARILWPGQNPLTKIVTVGDNPNEAEVIGVVGDVRVSLEKNPVPTVYLPYWAVSPPEMSFVIRASADPKNLSAAVRSSIWDVDSEVPIPRIETMDEISAGSISAQRYQLILILLFGGVALLLGCLGIYGVVSFSVARRTKEIGIRLALGGRISEVFFMILGQGMLPVLSGLVVGLTSGLLIARFLHNLLFEVHPIDLPTVYAAVIIQMLVAAVACGLPAIRACQTEPANVLRYE
jgi:predicted permease